MATTLTPAPTTRTEQASLPPIPELQSTATRRDLTLAYRFSGALAVIAAIASGLGVFHPDIFRETAWTTGNAQGTALVILAVAVPTVLVSMFLATRGSIRARIVWLGGLSY